jgi:N-acetylmuramoyl-L-alanine amidase
MHWSKAKRIRVVLEAGVLLAAVGLSASFSPYARMINVQTSPTPGTTAAPQTPPQESPTPAVATPVQQSQPSPVSQTHSQPVFFVMIDPGHGGDDRGAVFGSKLAEKDITLALARRLKSELQERGIPAHLLRDGDTTLSLDQRAETTNEQHASVYVALHAGMPGQGVRVYAPVLASFPSSSAGKFLPWDHAQANSLPRSQDLAQKIADELGKKKVAAMRLATPLRPLNNISAPAVAVELAPDPDNLQDMMAQKFQTTVAAGIAAGIAQLRPQWEGQP